MAGPFNDIELLFVKEVLDQWGDDDLIDSLHDSIVEKKLRLTDELLESLQSRVTMEGKNPKLTVKFMTYGRFIEIINKRKQREGVNTNALLFGLKENRTQKKRKNTDWYSKNAYGLLNKLISRLSYEYSEHEVKRLKGILEYQKQRGMQL
jgi:hypothetical protein